ncbi:NHL repeat containing protein [Oopsacas minuta]|uniref:NHL repeat containing protein n=1 Tax=Oopsacas minuta TaxID=111878 RepID=A0AAV7KDT0_9METZ|nr:NHL repeat containing protein [Oopsacas minuta]
MASIELKTTFTNEVEQTRKRIQYSFQCSHKALIERENMLLSRLEEIESVYKNYFIDKSNKEIEQSIEFAFDPLFESKITNLGSIKVCLPKPSHVSQAKPIIPDYKSKQVPIVYSCKNSTSKRSGEFNSPRCLAVHRKTGNIYVVDRDNDRVQVFTRSLIYLFMFSNQMNLPRGICIGQDRVYVTQNEGHYFTAYNLEGKFIDNVGRKGNGEGQFNSPLGITTFSQTNNIYICDRYNHRVQVFTQYLVFHSTFGEGLFKSPRDVKTKRNKVFVLDCSDLCMFVFNSDHTLLNRLISRGDGKQIESSYYFDVDRMFNIILSDYHSHCVYVFNQEGEQIHVIGKEGQEVGEFSYPFGIAIDATGGIIVVCEKDENCLQIF